MASISLLIPCYNNADTIRATLESIQSQDRTCLGRLKEVLLADDCSWDRTVSIARGIWRTEVPLRVLPRASNVGQWDNVNHALQSLAASAEWALILHSDDIAKPHWLPLMISRIDYCSPTVGTICSSWDNLHQNGRIEFGEDTTRPVEYLPGELKAVRNTLFRGCWWHISGCAVRLSAFSDVGFFSREFPYMSDYEWFLRCLRKGWAVEYIPRTLILWRRHPNSVSALSFLMDRDIRERMLILYRYADLLLGPELTRLHAELATFMFRRIGRSIINMHWCRTLRATESLALVVTNWLKCLRHRILSGRPGLPERVERGSHNEPP